MTAEDKKKRFIDKAIKKFGNKFDYSQVEYVSSVKPVKIICPEHGEFLQKPSDHLESKYGCPICGKEHSLKPLLGKEYIIEKSHEKFGDKFDFSKFVYNGINEKSCIICPKHGEFWQTPQSHLRSRTGCPQCGREQTILKTEEFIKKARKVHGNKYDYSKVDCKGYFSYVTIICPEHGEFIQRVENHLKGAGCSKCANVIPAISREEYIERCKAVYKDRVRYDFDYDNIVYKNNKTNIKATCKKHGNFEMNPKKFLDGNGCPYCRRENKFINEAVKKHEDKYDYSKVVYKDNNTPVCIIDKERGEFWQKPLKHLKGTGNNFPFDVYGYCESVAKQYNTMYDFYMNRRRCYAKAVKNGWIDNFTWLEKGKIWEALLHLIYVYEVSDGSVYIGLTKNMERRDRQHRGLIHPNSKSSLREYCEIKGFEIPKPRILESGLTIVEAQAAEKKWIKKYRDDGINVLNKTNGGEIGSLPFFAYEENFNNKDIDEIINEVRNYKQLWQVKYKRPKLYDFICENNLIDVCFPNRQKHKDNREYSQTFIAELIKKYPQKNDLRKGDVAAYMYLREHGLLYKYYPKGRVYKKT